MSRVIKEACIYLNDEFSVSKTSLHMIAADPGPAIPDTMTLTNEASPDVVNSEILHELETQADRAQKEAYAEGYERGYAEGFVAGTEKARSDAERQIAEIREQSHAEDENRLAEERSSMVKLCVSVAGELVSEAFSGFTTLTVLAAGSLLSSAHTTGDVTLRVAPDALPVMQQSSQVLAEKFGLDSIRMLPDAALLPGDVVLETSSGNWESHLQDRLEILGQSLLDKFYETR